MKYANLLERMRQQSHSTKAGLSGRRGKRGDTKSQNLKVINYNLVLIELYPSNFYPHDIIALFLAKEKLASGAASQFKSSTSTSSLEETQKLVLREL